LSFRPPTQWDVWFATLRDGIRGEQTYEHNVLVVSSSRISRNSRTVIVAPITTSHRDVPWLVEVEPQDAGIDRLSWIECDQLQALAPSPERFKTARGRLAAPLRPRVIAALRYVLEDVVDDTL
jgi:mRNA-degrading endonuclease toxin of MazEF toxin-antitoxin module